MFTGIIQSLGIIKKMDQEGGQSYHLIIEDAFIAARTQIGSSVCVSGVCLTVTQKEENDLYFTVMPETMRKTTLGEKRVGQKVNTEPALRMGDELGGHLVYGHIDGVTDVIGYEEEKDAALLTFALPELWQKNIIIHGSIAIDGVSLTVARLTENSFTVSLIPFTLEHTTLSELNLRDKVNIELDMMGKYVLKNV